VRARDWEAWKQDDSVELWVNVEANDGEDARETARRVVNDSAPMAAIRRSVEERGLDPIWTQLITEFGTMMYLQGWRSHWPPSSDIHERGPR
jgi:hypothetical protein